jgi:hypothetical protein
MRKQRADPSVRWPLGRLILAPCLFALAFGGQASDGPRSVYAAADADGRESWADVQFEEEPSPEAAMLLRVVEDRSLPLKQRGDAACRLGEQKEPAVIPRLSRLLPGDYTVLGRDIIVALGEIGDPRALPALENYTATAEKNGEEIPGKINVTLEWAMEKCKPK